MKQATLFICVVLMMLSGDHLFAQAKLTVVEGTTLDFGTIYRGDQFERTLTLKNSGSDTLVLGNVQASCGCTGAVLSSNRIAPGKTGALLIKFNSKNFTGPVHKTVTVSSNSADAERTLIEFTATVKDEIVLSPAQFWFKDVLVGKPASLTLTLKNAGGDTLRVNGFRTTLKGFSIDLPGPVAPGVTVDLVATFTAKDVTSVIADRVFLETTNPRQPDVAVPVYGNVKP